MTANSIRLTTPPGQTIGKLFALAPAQLEGSPPATIKIYLFGGSLCASQRH